MTADQMELGPGVWQDVPADAYHADPVPGGSLSASGVKDLLPPSCPAKFRHRQLHGRPDKGVFDFGRAAHRQVLGVGEDVVVVDADNWRTKAAKAEQAEARAAGKSPVLTHEWEVIEAMAAKLREHPVAAALLAPDSGVAEVTLVWEDPATGVKLRARLDWLRHSQPGRRLVVPDYKTCAEASPEAFSKAADNYGYPTQADHYLDGVRTLLGEPDPAFVFIAQEKTEPYLVSVFELDHVAMQIGAVRNRWARDLYAECRRTDVWPAYVPDHEPHLLALPRWAEIREGVTA